MSMLERESSVRLWARVVVLCASIILWIGACVETYQIAWGTGVWLGQFAPTWFVVFSAFVLFSILCLFLIARFLWQPQSFDRAFTVLTKLRNSLGIMRWLIAVLLLALPIYILQYTFWGIVLHGPYLRILLQAIISLLVAWLLTGTKEQLISWTSLLVSLVLTAGFLTMFAPLGRVTSYPFSLGWSEGNRLWDYSVMFGRGRYNYPADQPIPVFLDLGRQFVGAVAYLIPNATISQVRLWLALVDILPYIILGWVAFRPDKKDWAGWVLAGIWAFTYLRQGPIHAPLLICAILVALAWNRPLRQAAFMVFVAGYFAQTSRFTWLFAPAMWSVMLEFASAYELNREVWRRSFTVGIAGVLGGYVTPFIVSAVVQWWQSFSQSGLVNIGREGVTLSSVEEKLSSQPLIWSRLLPNETYPTGILLGLVLAVLPLILVLVHLAMRKRWQLNAWQKVSLTLPLLAFLVVGLIVSVKIGGGGDLHNLDMFIIGLLFSAAIIWRNGGNEWLRHSEIMPAGIATAVVLMLILPAVNPLLGLRPLSVKEDPQLVVTLADILPNDPLPDPLPDTLPAEDDTQRALQKVQDAVQNASTSGEVLFMDQRQLLTFGYVDNVPLIPDYDKKRLIDMAMADDAAYFETFYSDLAAHRFALIVTNPVNRRVDREEGHFDEENNAWVKWVTTPLLCYYEPLDVLKKVDVELLIPRKEPVDCSGVLPR